MQTEEEQLLQQKYLGLQMLEQQMKQYQKQVQLFENQLIELTTIDKGLDDLSKTKSGTGILVSLGPGIFTKAELKDNKELVVNVGASIAVKKDIASTKELINNQIEELKRLQNQSLEELQRLSLQAKMIEQDLNKITKNKNV